jgi:hypothetical protein
MKLCAFISLIAICIFPDYSISQTSFGDDGFGIVREFQQYQKTMGKTITNARLRYDNISGSPYLYDHFMRGELITHDSVKYINVSLRYNIYTDEMEFEIGDEFRSIANPESFRYFLIGNDLFVFQPIQRTISGIKSGYFLVLISGETMLFKRLSVIFEPPAEPQAYAAARQARFTKKADTYFIRFKGSLPIELSMNRRKILDAFPDKNSELENFIQKNRLNFRKEEDLIKLVAFYNQL